MARLNWQKLNQQSRQQSHREKSSSPSGLAFSDNYLWALQGKYYGTSIKNLPTNYLFWILDNHSTGKYREQAEGEIYRRYRELSNT